MPRKFVVGDKARIAPERLPYYYPPGVRVGRVVTITRVLPTTHGGKCYYMIGNNRKGGLLRYRSDDLRRLTEPSLRGGARKRAGRKPRATGGYSRASQGV